MSAPRLLDRLTAAWERSDAIFELVSPEAMLDQPIPLRQPILFYLGHLPAFAWNQVCRGELKMPSFAPAFDALFERGIDPIDVDEHAPGDASQWPSTREVLAYRDRVRQELRRAFEEERPTPVFEMVIEHELMHQETLLYMLQELPLRRKVRGAAEAIVRREAEGSLAPAPAPAPAQADFPTRVRVHDGKARVSAGKAVLGAPKSTEGFTWDNELPTLEVSVPSFLIDVLPVQNGDYLEFVRASGYATRALWSDDGWAWKERRGVRHPHGWSRDGSSFRVRTLLDEIPLAEAASLPVMVSFAEAEAYARWKGEKLPTEAELHRAMYGSPDGGQRRYPWGDAEPNASHGNFGFQRLSPAPVGSFPLGASAWGVMDLIGNGWEWTRSPFEPFPGFEVTMPSYPGYSKDFFDGSHYVLLGASWATDRALIRRSFRNWFQPHYPYVFSKFRCTAPA